MVASGRTKKLTKPRKLLPGLLKSPAGIWVDAACGDGVFAEALVEIADPTLAVLGLDFDSTSIRRFRSELKSHKERFYALQADLRNPLPLAGVDGIMLANGLHFFPEPEQIKILKHCAAALKQDGQIIVVEYNTRRSTHAVPYPVFEDKSIRLLSIAGFSRPEHISRVSSTYLGELYAVLAKKVAQ